LRFDAEKLQPDGRYDQALGAKDQYRGRLRPSEGGGAAIASVVAGGSHWCSSLQTPIGNRRFIISALHDSGGHCLLLFMARFAAERLQAAVSGRGPRPWVGRRCDTGSGTGAVRGSGEQGKRFLLRKELSGHGRSACSRPPEVAAPRRAAKSGSLMLASAATQRFLGHATASELPNTGSITVAQSWCQQDKLDEYRSRRSYVGPWVRAGHPSGFTTPGQPADGPDPGVGRKACYWKPHGGRREVRAVDPEVALSPPSRLTCCAISTITSGRSARRRHRLRPCGLSPPRCVRAEDKVERVGVDQRLATARAGHRVEEQS